MQKTSDLGHYHMDLTWFLMYLLNVTTIRSDIYLRYIYVEIYVCLYVDVLWGKYPFIQPKKGKSSIICTFPDSKSFALNQFYSNFYPFLSFPFLLNVWINCRKRVKWSGVKWKSKRTIDHCVIELNCGKFSFIKTEKLLVKNMNTKYLFFFFLNL